MQSASVVRAAGRADVVRLCSCAVLYPPCVQLASSTCCSASLLRTGRFALGLMSSPPSPARHLPPQKSPLNVHSLPVHAAPHFRASAAPSLCNVSTCADLPTVGAPRLCFLLRTSLLPRRQFRLVRRSLCCARRSRQFLRQMTDLHEHDAAAVSILRPCAYGCRSPTERCALLDAMPGTQWSPNA